MKPQKRETLDVTIVTRVTQKTKDKVVAFARSNRITQADAVRFLLIAALEMKRK